MASPSQEQKIQPVVYCGNLSAKTTSAELISIFSTVASVSKISLRKRPDNVTAFAFVTFASIKDAEKIISRFNFYALHNKQMNLSLYNPDKNRYPPDSNIFVKNLPAKLNSKDLNEVFNLFGPIASCKVVTDERGESKCYGFIQYWSAKSAHKAMTNCEGAKIGPYELQVKYYNSAKEPKAEAALFTNIYVKNFPKKIKEVELKAILEKFGPLTSFYMPEENGVSVGFAFANYEEPQHALDAVTNLHDKMIFDEADYDGELVCPLPFYAQKAEKKKDRMEELKKKMNLLSIDNLPSKKNLYVSNIPITFKVEDIKGIFSKFGTIVNLKLQEIPQTNLQYCYVCYSSSEEADAAFNTVSKETFNGAKLQIAFYKNKFERINDFTTPLKLTPISFAGSSSTIANSNYKLIQSILNTIEKSANLYKDSWESLNVTNSNGFVKAVSRHIYNLNESELKDLISSTDLLSKKIRAIVDNTSKD